MFLDEAHIEIIAGDGGNGAIAWRREKYEPNGGPAGGDGGKGGSIIAESSTHMQTLLDFKYKTQFMAQPGENGATKNRTGHGGQDYILKVPVGTVITDADTGVLLADLSIAGQRVLLAEGGRGGRGNTRFATARHQAPHYAEPGEPGVQRNLNLSLKLIADVGLVGMPNAGKSTLLSVVSAARPKIADYPFTTLVPNLGVVSLENAGDTAFRFVMADIPGLIEGASEGKGLGHQFLKHIERCGLLLHLVALDNLCETPEAAADEAYARYEQILHELSAYSKTLAQKPQWLVLTKTDTLTPEQVSAQKAAIKQRVQSKQPALPIFCISAATHAGLEPLLKAVADEIRQHQSLRLPEDTPIDTTPNADLIEPVAAKKHLAVAPGAKLKDELGFEVETQRAGVYRITGPKVRRWLAVTPVNNPSSVRHLMDVLKAMGVQEALKAAGAQPGDEVWIEDQAFDYDPVVDA
ncbi:MAG: GTPase ObgE [Vampirovibrionales bacterium]|nr:GTPase ObgE [Vampirovibrionales bacterium]